MKETQDINEEGVVTLTPMGLMSLSIGDELARNASDELELYCRRFNVGIAVDHDNVFRFVKLAPFYP